MRPRPPRVRTLARTPEWNAPSPIVVLLAGGRSARFGRDKLLEPVDGLAVIARVARAARPIASRLVLSAPEARLAELQPLLPHGTGAVPDAPAVWGPGPGGAIASVLAQSEDRPVLFLPSDMPWLSEGAIRHLAEVAARSGAEVVAVYWSDGTTEHLIQWHSAPLDDGDRAAVPRPAPGGSLRASEFLRAAPRTLWVPVSALTSDPREFAHLTYPTDRDRPSPRGRLGEGDPMREIVGSPKAAYRNAIRAFARGDHAIARLEFERESLWYQSAWLPRLSEHAARDAGALLEPK